MPNLLLFVRAVVFGCIFFLVGYFFRVLTNDTEYRVPEQLISAVTYIEAYEREAGQLPTRLNFQQWVNKNYYNWSFNYYPNFFKDDNVNKNHENPDYIVGSFTGDEMLYFTSWDQSFRHERNLSALVKNMNKDSLSKDYRVDGGKILAPVLDTNKP